tara:strand:+ start:966 stop:1253 length:288 start_codon:yes stop_codon:yes gene_type:complete
MKNLLILYNVIFFFAGNVLLSNIHHLNHHHHHHHNDLIENQECYECINFENSKDYILDLKEVKFSNTFESIVIECPKKNEFVLPKERKSRAPPIS